MAQYLLISGTQVVLPDYARLDLAFPVHIVPGTQPNGTPYTYSAASGYVEIPLNLYVAFNTSAAVATRLVVLDVLNGNGTTVASYPASITQTAGLAVNYTLTTGDPAAYAPTSTYAIINFPATVLDVGWQVRLSASNLDANDALRNVAITTMRIPTGPTRSTVSPPAAATPILV